MTTPPLSPTPPLAPPPPVAPGPAYPPPSAVHAGRASSSRLIVVFIAILVVGVVAAGAAAILLQSGPPKADCPPAPQPCGAPPIVPTLPPIGRASPTANPTPAATIVRPSGTLVISSPGP